MRFWAGLNTAEPFTPSLNQIRSCKPAWVNNAAGIGPMFGCVVSPKAAVNKPFRKGDKAEADRLYSKVATWNQNDLGYAVVRARARAKKS